LVCPVHCHSAGGVSRKGDGARQKKKTGDRCSPFPPTRYTGVRRRREGRAEWRAHLTETPRRRDPGHRRAPPGPIPAPRHQRLPETCGHGRDSAAVTARTAAKMRPSKRPPRGDATVDAGRAEGGESSPETAGGVGRRSGAGRGGSPATRRSAGGRPERGGGDHRQWDGEGMGSEIWKRGCLGERRYIYSHVVEERRPPKCQLDLICEAFFSGWPSVTPHLLFLTFTPA
jgi:hypothetical protein